MSGFSADWLALREPFDARARDASWPAFNLQANAARRRAVHPRDPHLAVTDLACGTGANLRALAPRIGGPQRWRLLDHDQSLLAAMPGAMQPWARHHGYRIDAQRGGRSRLHVTGPGFSAEVVTECIDLVHGLDAIGLAHTDLLTASALLDLVSAEWLEALVSKACVSRAALLFALSVDGRTTWDPADAGDAAVHGLFRQHQSGDKGFGPALGPLAVPHACRVLAAAGYATVQARSDWVIDPGRAAGFEAASGANGEIRGAADGQAGADHPDAPAMQAAMIAGMAAAAIEQDSHAAPTVLAWKNRRLALAPASRLTVGHVELMGTA